MTPRRLDPEVISGKLRAMRRLLHELDRLGPVDADRFAWWAPSNRPGSAGRATTGRPSHRPRGVTPTAALP